jgi:4-hydroxyphenylpyruvate dioxygenase
MNNPLGIKRFGPITLYVHDAAHEAQRLSKMLGMEVTYTSPGNPSVYGIQAHDALFILDSSPRCAALAAQYGNHIAEIGLRVKSSKEALETARKKTNQVAHVCEATGVTSLTAPHDGEICFRFLEDEHLPHKELRPVSVATTSVKCPFSRIDHIVTNTQKIAPFVEFLRDVFGMERVNEFTIKVQNEEFTASLYSEVMGLYGSEHPILLPINEPLSGDDTSQIPAQLREVGRSHVQHVALLSESIIESISLLREKGLAFLDFRNAEHAAHYYQSLPSRLGSIPVHEAIDKVKSLGILVDKCGQGYLLQLFSKRVFDEKSVPFLEIIQRASDVLGCFGDGNFAALAEALEHSMRKGRQ